MSERNRGSKGVDVKLENQNMLWQLYYLRKKYITDRTLHSYVDRVTSLSTALSTEAKQAIDYGVLKIGGKRIRPILTYLTHDIVGGSSPVINELAIVSELPHKGSLLEDDIDDHAEQRDGKLPTYKVYGLEATTEAFKFLYNAPQLLIESLSIPPEDRDYLLGEYLRLADKVRQGQQKDVAWGNSDHFPTPTEYLKMCEEKCAAFEYAIRVGARAGETTKTQDEVLVRIGNNAAVSFQLMDDLLSLRTGSDDYGSDIKEGKKTLPIIYACQQSRESKRLAQILSLHTDNRFLINDAARIVQESGAIERTTEDALILARKAQNMLKEEFPDSKYRKIFSSIITHGVTRKG